MRALAALGLCGAGLVLLAGRLGGRGAVIGGLMALLAQLAAVGLLRPAMRRPTPEFMARWIGGMAVRASALAALLVAVVVRRPELPPLATSLGFLGVLLPLLFLETKFLK